MIDEVTKNLEKFNYNVAIANLHKTYNFLNKQLDKEIDNKQFLENYIKILKIMLPIMPHIASECLEELGYKEKLEWPKIDKKYLLKKNIDIVIQINGKKRGVINLKKDIGENEVINKINENEKINKYLKDKKINKSIFIQNKLINLIIK